MIPDVIGYGSAVCAVVFVGVFVVVWLNDEDAPFAAGAACYFAIMAALALVIVWAFVVAVVGQ